MHLINSMTYNILSNVVFQPRVKYMFNLQCSRKEAWKTWQLSLRVTGTCMSLLSRICASWCVLQCCRMSSLKDGSSPSLLRDFFLALLWPLYCLNCVIIPCKASILFHQLDVSLLGEEIFAFLYPCCPATKVHWTLCPPTSLRLPGSLSRKWGQRAWHSAEAGPEPAGTGNFGLTWTKARWCVWYLFSSIPDGPKYQGRWMGAEVN